MRGWLVVVFLAACGKDVNRLPAPLAALDDAYTRTPELAKTFDPNGLVLSPAGLFANGGRRSMYMDFALHLAGALDAAPKGATHSLVVMPGAPPAAITMIAMAAAKRGWRELHIGAFRDGSITSVCRLSLSRPPSMQDGEELVQLSIYLMADSAWVALSRVNEFQQIPNLATGGLDRTKLATVIKDHKASGFFAERDDMELAAEREIDLATYLGVLDDACTQFHSIALVPPQLLRTRPAL